MTMTFKPKKAELMAQGFDPAKTMDALYLDDPRAAAFARIDATTHYHALQIRDFLRSILDDRPPLVTGDDGRAVVALFTAIYRSHRERRPIAFPLSADDGDGRP